MSGPAVEPKVAIVALAFSAGPNTLTTFRTGLGLAEDCLCAAFVSDPDAVAIKENWDDSTLNPLMLFHAPSKLAGGWAVEFLEALPSGPLAVLIAEEPGSTAFDRMLRWGRPSEFIQEVHQTRRDIQIHRFSPVWHRRPPRVL